METMTFVANVESLSDALSFVEEELKKNNTNNKNIKQILIAFEEMFVNIAHYAYSENDGNVVVSVEADNKKVRVELKDCGKPFNPLEKKDPDVNLSIEERQVGGLGIFIVKNIMDRVNYKYEDGKNMFAMEKDIL